MARSSEFGRGLAVCLFMFLCHEPRLRGTLRLYRKYQLYTSIREGVFSDSSAVERWANRATDHLYEMVITGRISAAHRATARMVQGVGLDMGHGFLHKYTVEEAETLVAMARELLVELGDPKTLDEAVAIDRRLGIRVDISGYACRKPLPEDM